MIQNLDIIKIVIVNFKETFVIAKMAKIEIFT